MEKNMCVKMTAAWSKNHKILMDYYINQKKDEQINNAQHWFNVQVGKSEQKKYIFSKKQKEYLLQIAQKKYRIESLPKYAATKRIFVKKNSTTKLLPGEQKIYRYLCLALNLEVYLEKYDYKQWTELKELNDMVKQKPVFTTLELLQIYTDILQRIEKGKSLIDIKNTEPNLYKRFRQTDARHVSLKPNEAQRFRMMKEQIRQKNSILRSKKDKRKEREQHIIEIFERVEQYYLSGKNNLYQDDKTLYSQYLKYWEKRKTESEELQVQLHKRYQNIENAKKLEKQRKKG